MNRIQIDNINIIQDTFDETKWLMFGLMIELYSLKFEPIFNFSQYFYFNNTENVNS